MELLDLIETKKKELTVLNEKMNGLKSEISNLETELDRELNKPKLNNFDSCFNPIKLVEKDCPACSFYDECGTIRC